MRSLKIPLTKEAQYAHTYIYNNVVMSTIDSAGYNTSDALHFTINILLRENIDMDFLQYIKRLMLK